VAKTLGEGRNELAKKYFTLFVLFTTAIGIAASAICITFLKEICIFLGAEGALLDCCIRYGRIVILAQPAFMLQNLFQSFFIVAEKPKLGLAVTLAAGVANIVLDAVLVLSFPQELKLEGAALATSISQLIGGFFPVIYFLRKNTSLLRFTRTRLYFRALFKAITNGSPELLSNISASVVTLLYNQKLLELEGERGVAAYGAIMYVGFIFVAMFIGYAVGTAPLTGYNYGAANKAELKNLFKKSITICTVAGIAMVLIGEIFAYPLSFAFTGTDAELLALTVRGFRIFSFTFICSGLSIYASSMFTALNDGLTSAILAFSRTVLFQITLILTLPLWLGTDGVWLSSLLAEVLALITSTIFVLVYRKKYGYI
jgi:Na+-driven multidrug efflux pump